MPQFLVAQIGARRHYAIPRMLSAAGMLDHFCTDICAAKGWPASIQVSPATFRVGRQKNRAFRATD